MNYKNIFTVLFVCLAGMLHAQSMAKYVADSLNFSVQYPEDWQLIENYTPNIPMAVVSPLEGAGDLIRENMNIVTEKVKRKNINLETYTSLNILGISNYLEDVTIDTTANDSTLSGLVRKYIVYNHSSEKSDFKVLAYFFLHNSTGYVITCTARKNTYANYEKQFREICRSFDILRNE